MKHFMHQPSGKGSQIELGYQREAVMRPPLRTIIAIFATLSQVGSHSSRVMSIATRSNLEDQILESKRVKIEIRVTLGFSNEDKIGTYQPHDDALVVTLRIRGYDVIG